MNIQEQKIKTIFIPFLAWIVLLGYLFWGPNVYAYLIKKDGRPSQKNIQINAQIATIKEARGYINDLKSYKGQLDIYQFTGWAFPKLPNGEPTDIYETEIVVFDGSKNYIFKTELTARADIVDLFSDLGVTIINPGFSGLINKHAIDYGKYCIALKLSHKENKKTLLIITNKVLIKTPFMFEIDKNAEFPCGIQ
jgi:hypothetical protein